VTPRKEGTLWYYRARRGISDAGRTLLRSTSRQGGLRGPAPGRQSVRPAASRVSAPCSCPVSHACFQGAWRASRSQSAYCQLDGICSTLPELIKKLRWVTPGLGVALLVIPNKANELESVVRKCEAPRIRRPVNTHRLRCPFPLRVHARSRSMRTDWVGSTIRVSELQRACGALQGDRGNGISWSMRFISGAPNPRVLRTSSPLTSSSFALLGITRQRHPESGLSLHLNFLISSGRVLQIPSSWQYADLGSRCSPRALKYMPCETGQEQGAGHSACGWASRSGGQALDL